MACNNNTPKNGYIYIESLVIEFNGTYYPINNLVVKGSNVYWNSKDPSNLYVSEKRLLDDKLFFIIKNMNGNGVIMNNPHVRLIFDNFDKEKMKENVNALISSQEEYDIAMEGINNDVESLSNRYQENKTFEEIKEELNTSLINLNSLLITLNSNLTNYLSDNDLSAYEKGELNTTLNNTCNASINVLAYTDALIDVYAQYTEEDARTNTPDISQYKLLLETYTSQLKVDLTKLIESSTNNVTIEVVIPITSCINNMIDGLINLKNACSELKFLGSGGTIPYEIAYANDRINRIINQMEEYQQSVMNSMSAEKKEIDKLMDSIRVTLNKIVVLSNDTIATKGVMTQAQYDAFSNHCFTLQSLYTEVQGYYEAYYNNSKVSASTKKSLADSFEVFKTKHFELMAFVNNKLSDLNMSSSDRSQFSTTYQQYKDSRYTLTSKIVICINEINTNGSEATLKVINDSIDSLQTQVTALSNKLTILENNYTLLEERVKTLEG